MLQPMRLLLLALSAPLGTAAEVIDVGSVRIQLCTPEIVRVQAAVTLVISSAAAPQLPGAALAKDGRSYQQRALAPQASASAVNNKTSLVVNAEWAAAVAHTVSKHSDGSTSIATAELKIVVGADASTQATHRVPVIYRPNAYRLLVVYGLILTDCL